MSGPFRIEIDLGGGSVVGFDLSEDEIRDRAKLEPSLSSAIAAAKDDERKGLRTAAYLIAIALLDPSRDPGQPVVVVEDESVAIVPLSSIRAIRMRDPELAKGKPIGFATDFGGD